MTEVTTVRCGDVFIGEVSDPHGGKIRKRRPFVVISPDDMNAAQDTYLAAPLTAGQHPYVYRVQCDLRGKRGHVVLDQVYTFDADEARHSVGRLPPSTMRDVLAVLREMFAE